MEFFDSHAHYDDEKFNSDRDEVISSVKAEGITRLVSVGYNVDSSKFAEKLSEEYDFIYYSCGVSPNDIPQTEQKLWKALDEIRKIAKQKYGNPEETNGNNKDEAKQENSMKQKNKKLVAIGEIGLDYYWNKQNADLQKIAFIEQIKLANKCNLPIIIHTREAVADTIDILKNRQKSLNTGIFHCCPLNRELVKEALKLGYYISFAGPITFKNSKNASEIIDMVPLDKILIETDSPYLSPEPNRGKRNDSRNVKFMAKKIAEVKQMSLEEIARITYENANRVFKI